eukprot:UN25845
MADQSLLSFVVLPFSLKLLWAPLVDSVFIRCFGRRKTWLIPCQLIICFMFFYLGYTIDSLINVDIPSIPRITALFMLLYFFTATQDIAVDGWALTLLKTTECWNGSNCQCNWTNSWLFSCFHSFIGVEQC